MKKYTKVINGIQTVSAPNNIIVRINGKQIINPSIEMIINDGWEEYKPTTIEFTEEELLEKERTRIKGEILMYDSSFDVNAFYMQNIEMWLDKSTRTGLMLRLQAELAMGKVVTTLWYESQQFEIPIDNAVQMLYALEVYASQCYDNTQRHIANVSNLQTIEELKNYNYRDGYPEKLKF